MTKVIIEDRMPGFLRNMTRAADTTLSAMGVDVLRISKQQVPVKQGRLSSTGKIEKAGDLKYKLSYGTQYAAYQHRGARRDGSRKVRNYSYPGRKAKYLSDPAKDVWNNRKTYISRYLARVSA